MYALLVEDNAAVAISISGMLKEIGYPKVKEAINYAEAMQYVQDSRPEVAVLDYDLNEEKNGLDVAQFLAQKNIPFVLMTEYQTSDLLEKVNELGGIHLDKNITPNVLRNTLSHLKLNRKEKALLPKLVMMDVGEGKRIKVDLDKVVRISANRSTCYLHFQETDREPQKVGWPMKEIFTRHFAQNRDLMQVNRSEVIRLSAIHAQQGNRIWLTDGTEVKIGRTYKADVEARLTRL